MGLDKCIKTCIHHYNIIQSIFTALRILCALPIYSSPRPFPLATTNIFIVSMSLTILGTSCKWNDTVFVFLCLAYFSQHNVFKVCIYCSMCQNSIPFKGGIIFHYMYTPHLVYPFTCQWTLVWLPTLACCE